MIRCPRCGGAAQWGAIQCPHCGVPFVAPPTAQPPPGQAPALGWQQPLPPARRGNGAAIAIGLVAAAALLGGWAAFALRSKSPSAHPSASLAMAAGPVDPGSSGGGIFKVEKQAQQEPVIAISDSAPDDLRLTLQDQNGQVETQMIRAYTSQTITVPQGSYYATIDAPDNAMILPSTGEVDVKEFHHYAAQFGEVPAGQSDRTFYIGD